MAGVVQVTEHRDGRQAVIVHPIVPSHAPVHQWIARAVLCSVYNRLHLRSIGTHEPPLRAINKPLRMIQRKFAPTASSPRSRGQCSPRRHSSGPARLRNTGAPRHTHTEQTTRTH